MSRPHTNLSLSILLMGLFVVNSISAQQIKTVSSKNKRLYIGDTVPEVMLDYMRNYKGNSAKLSDFKGKCVILDFWNRYCSACINGMPHMQEIQDEFADKVQVLLVTSDKPEELQGLFKRSITMKYIRIPMVMGNNTLRDTLFPHYGDPYHVWLDQDHIVRAITYSDAATKENINDLIHKRKLNVPVRTDYMDEDLNNYNSLLTANKGRYIKHLIYYKRYANIQTDVNSQSVDSLQRLLKDKVVDDQWPNFPFYSLIMRKIDGYVAAVSSALLDSASNRIVGIRLNNQTIPGLYSQAYSVSSTSKMLIDSGENYFEPKGLTSIELADWRKKNTFSYEVTLPNYSNEEGMRVMREDLRFCFGMIGKWEERTMPCLILYRIDKKDRLQTKGGDTLFENTGVNNRGIIINNTPYQVLISLFRNNYTDAKDPIIIDETGIDESTRIDMIIKSPFRDLLLLRKELEKYGLGVKEEPRGQKVFVLTK